MRPFIQTLIYTLLLILVVSCLAVPFHLRDLFQNYTMTINNKCYL